MHYDIDMMIHIGGFKNFNDKEKLVGHFVTAKSGQYSKNMICKIDVKT